VRIDIVGKGSGGSVPVMLKSNIPPLLRPTPIMLGALAIFVLMQIVLRIGSDALRRSRCPGA
jgi:hypothetical protein